MNNTIIYVHHAKPIHILKREISILSRLGKVIDIDTARSDKYSGINDFFEFSGYQFGLDLILRENEYFEGNLFFLNSTIFDSHYSYLYVYLVKLIIRNYSKDKKQELYGLVQNKQDYKIVPTCFFCLSNFKFNYIDNIFVPEKLKINPINVNDLYVGNKNVYNERLDSWLFPKRFFGGWYKASKFKSLGLDTVKRKKLAIFLEHILVSNLVTRDNFKLIDVSNFNYFVQILVKIDIYKQMYFKIKYRLFTMLLHRPKVFK
ncbi:hypothetical protein [Vibrio ziniensis]|uniref:Uncharacterized protein n=1 Tax=Vibrio ziniensis TaxID=2711221 RepID=A0A6G7CLM6_9VIBR|nr:hypothetical protein [Vibrio ziniensis]QIH42970.1 hypothetical protein G5S32_13900 [Vibrio ziniensis]